MDYDIYLRREVYDFLRECRPSEREHLLAAIRRLGADPFRPGDFSERDNSGRDIQGLIIRRYAILFWVDHAVKEVKVTDIRLADR